MAGRADPRAHDDRPLAAWMCNPRLHCQSPALHPAQQVPQRSMHSRTEMTKTMMLLSWRWGLLEPSDLVAWAWQRATSPRHHRLSHMCRLHMCRLQTGVCCAAIHMQVSTGEHGTRKIHAGTWAMHASDPRWLLSVSLSWVLAELRLYLAKLGDERVEHLAFPQGG